MKKNILFIIAIFVINSSSLFSQTCQWAKSFGGDKTDAPASTCFDASGNYYIAGYYKSETLAFNNGISLTNHKSDSNDCFIAKYNSLGHCQWVQNIGGTNSDIAWSLAVDSTGNIYVGGVFKSNTINFNNGIFLENTSILNDGFLAKYDSNGLCLWAETLGGENGDDYIYSISINKSGDVFICGNYLSSNMYFNNDVRLQNSGGVDVFFAKYNSNGQCQWAKSINGNKNELVYKIALDNSDNIYVCGITNSPETIFGNGMSVTNGGLFDGYIAKYNVDGQLQWVNSIIGEKNDYAQNLAIDHLGNVYLTGFFYSSSIDFNNGKTISRTSSTTEDCFVVKYNQNGQCQWAEKIAGISSDEAMGITIDVSGSVYIAGDFKSDVLYFNNNINLNISNSGFSDGFFAKYNTNGNCEWAKKIGGDSSDYVNSIDIDRDGNLFVCGYYKSNIINFTDDINISKAGNTDIFIAKYKFDLNSVADENSNSIDFSISPNPSSEYIVINLKNENENIDKFEIYSELGVLVLSLESENMPIDSKINISQLPQGAYRALVKTKSGAYTKALSVIK